MMQHERNIAGEFFFDPQDPIYRDHFPGRPTVPGSLIVHAFIMAAERHVAGIGRLLNAENFRFRHFVPPGTYAYRLEEVVKPESAGTTLRCTLFAGDRVVACGVLH